tara:strand:+ start:391 stop:1305 length:915 start_codon:yes stop_codon:yes gene_type:complete
VVEVADHNVWSFYPTDNLYTEDFIFDQSAPFRNLTLRPYMAHKSEEVQIVRQYSMSTPALGAVTGWVEFIPNADPIGDGGLTEAQQQVIFVSGIESPTNACRKELNSAANYTGDIANVCLGSSYPAHTCYEGLDTDRFCRTVWKFYVAMHWCFGTTPGCVEELWMEPLFEPEVWDSTWSSAMTIDGMEHHCRRYLEYNEIEIRYDTQEHVTVTNAANLITDFSIIQDPTDSPTPAPPATHCKDNAPLWVGIVLGILVLSCGCCGYYAVSLDERRDMDDNRAMRSIYKNVPFNIQDDEDPEDVTP